MASDLDILTYNRYRQECTGDDGVCDYLKAEAMWIDEARARRGLPPQEPDHPLNVFGDSAAPSVPYASMDTDALKSLQDKLNFCRRACFQHLMADDDTVHNMDQWKSKLDNIETRLRAVGHELAQR